MTSRPRVSVVLPVCNGERYVAEAIESVLSQSYKSYEIVAVNDGSRDGSADIIKRYLASGRVKYVEQGNRGVANARNTAIAHSSGEFIAMLDQDDVWLPDKLEKQVAFMDAHREVGLVHANVSCIDGAGKPISCKGWVAVAEYEGYCAERLLAGNGITPLTVLIRRSCLDEVGVFDQAFAPADDWHLWLRIALRFPLGLQDAVVGRYRVHDSNESKNQLNMKFAGIRVLESFRFSLPAHVRRMSRKNLESRLIGGYEEAAELLSRAGQSGEAKALQQKAMEIKLRAPWYYAEQLVSRLPEKPQRMVRWYWYRIRSLLDPHWR